MPLKRTRGGIHSLTLAGGAAAAALVLGAPARADLPPDFISYIAFTVQASSALGTAFFHVTLNDGSYNAGAGTYEWRSTAPIALHDPFSPQTTIATLHSADIQYSTSGGIVNLDFAVMAGSMKTDVTITSALVGVGLGAGGMGRATAALTVTDFNGDGAQITGLGPGGGSYLAQYNGLVPGGTTFAELLPSLAAPMFSSNAAASNFPGGGAFAAIGGPISDMSSQFHFSLSAFDLASGTSNFEIIPAPAGLALLGLGALLGRRRRRG